MKKCLINYTKMPKETPGFIKNKNAFIYPFDRAVSRTKYKADHFHFKLESESIAELLSLPNLNLSWSECCFKRAKELLDLKKSTYYFSYSGGIDSTGALVALLQAWPQSELSKVVLVLTSHSIDENPVFFSKYLTGFRWLNYMDGLDFLIEENAIMVTGVNGDQLFGSDIYFPACRKFGEKILKEDYQDHVTNIYDLWNKQGAKVEIKGNYLFEHFHPAIEECPFKIKTVFDYFWWLNFTQKWQHVKLKYLEGKNLNLKIKYGEKVIHFFDTSYFQHWSLNNHDLKIKDTLLSYKWEAKKFIHTFVKDDSQLSLTKQYSVQKTYAFLENRIAVNDHYEEIQSMKELEEYARI